MAGANPLERDELEQVLSHLKSSRDICLFVLGVTTGFRISELLSIKVRDVCRDNSILDRLRINRRHIKAKSEGREVVLNKWAKTAIKGYLNENSLLDDDYLFKSRIGVNQPIKRCQAHNILKEAFNQSGLTVGFSTHTMRKTFAQSMYKALDHDLIATRDALGHSDIATTVKYISSNQEKINNAVLKNNPLTK